MQKLVYMTFLVSPLLALFACQTADRDYKTDVSVENSEIGGNVDGSIGGGGDTELDQKTTVTTNLALDPSAFSYVFGAVKSVVPNPSASEVNALKSFANRSANSQQRSDILDIVSKCESQGEKCTLAKAQ